MVLILRHCYCGCSLKTGTVTYGVLNIVSANFPSRLHAVYRNVSFFSRKNTKIKEIIVNWCSWSIANKHKHHVPTVYCNIFTLLKKSAKGNMNVKNEQSYIILYTRVDINNIWALEACLKCSCLRVTKTVNKGDWKHNKNACILK